MNIHRLLMSPRFLIALGIVSLIVIGITAAAMADITNDEKDKVNIYHDICHFNKQGEMAPDGEVEKDCVIIEDIKYKRYRYAIVKDGFGNAEGVFRIDTTNGTSQLVWERLPNGMSRI